MSNTPKTTQEDYQKLLQILKEFHAFQIDDQFFGEPPYSYNTLGLAEWLEFQKLEELKENL